MDFGDALRALKGRQKVAREGWNGKNMHLFYVDWCEIHAKKDEATVTVIGSLEIQPFIAMLTAQGKYVPWLASQTDVLAEDWSIVR